MVVSFAGTAFSHIVLGTYIYLSTETNINLDAFQWIPVASFSAMIFIASCGALPIPYVIVSEILPDKVREREREFFSVSGAQQFEQMLNWNLFFFSFVLLSFNLDSKHWNNINSVHFMGSYIRFG